MEAPEEVLLDVDKMAEGHAYFAIGGISISDDQQLMVYGVDTVSRRQYTLYVKNLATGEVMPHAIANTDGQAEWAADNKTFFYTVKNPQTLLTERVYRHKLGTAQQDDVLVYQEKDPSNYIFISKSKSGAYIFIVSYATLSSEWLMIPANRPEADFVPFQQRMPNVLYSVSHAGNKFFVRTNLNAFNFRLMECPEGQTAASQWKELVPHRPDVLLESVDVFADYMVLAERTNGLVRLRVCSHDMGKNHYISFDEPAYTASLEDNPDFNSKVFRYNYTSLTTPYSLYEYHMETRAQILLKQREIPGGYNARNYVTERLWAPAPDGVKVPISIVYRKGFKPNGTSPLLLYGYGSYGYSIDASFDATRLSLLDRGFSFAIAHIRGGEELGRQWYEDGKLLKKKNSFTDFIACGEYLLKTGYAAPKRLYAQGASAGGLLMGGVVNMRPQLWQGVIAEVPFVDVINTMLDESIPLTTNEYDEWGNPKNKIYYDYIKSYSPYDNVTKQAYPHMLVTTGLHDSQVQYWEPAKWVAKLRANKTDKNLLLLRTNMEQGHGGASGRFEYLKDLALQYAFLLAVDSRAAAAQ
jgi:oligopeptidase B